VQRGVNPRDVDVLLSDSLRQPLAYIVAHGEERIDPAGVDALLRRRFNGEPLQYIRRRAEFFGHEFYIDDRVLIPRPETEVLVETAIARAPGGARVVDVGTGSGSIAVSLQRARPDLRVVGVDSSLGALAVAKINGATALIVSDVLSAFRKNFDLVVANPPYIAAQEMQQLAPEVRDHEPQIALTPGARGTEIIERILAQANTDVIMEMAMGQEPAIRELAATHRYEIDAVINDLAGIPRVVVLSARGRR